MATLPRLAKGKGTQNQRLEPSERKKLRLVVEDDAMIGGLLAETEAASRWRPDLMIVDVGISEASGIAVVREILRTRDVPRVLVTGDVVRGMPLGPETVFIQKPFGVTDLERAIQRALEPARVRDHVAK